MNMRGLWLRSHRWVGLAIALPLLLVSLSGAVMVFEDQIDRALNPQVSFVTPGGQVLAPSDVVRRAAAAFPDAQLGALTFPDRPDYALQISATSKALGPFTVGVDPYTGQILGTRTAAAREAGAVMPRKSRIRVASAVGSVTNDS